MEVEVKAKLDNSDLILNKIKKLGSKLEYEAYQKDNYFKPASSKKKFILRLRLKDDKCELTYKELTGIDGAWKEFSTKISDIEQTRKILLEAEFYEWMTLEKKRKCFKLNEMEINLDSFTQPKDFGTWIEAEVITDNAEEGKRKIKEFLESLGIPRDKFIDIGYPEIIDKQRSK
jgi:predicted adenylyl cyclase CyaB